MADPEILVLGGPERDLYLAPADLERLDSFANWTWLPCEAGQVQPGHLAELSRRLASVQALVVYSGAPHIGPELMEQAPELRLIGELNGDRFAERIAHGFPSLSHNNPAHPKRQQPRANRKK